MEQTKALAVLEKKAAPVIKKAVTIVTIASQEDQQRAAALLTQLNKYNDELTALKKTVTTPLNSALKAARALFAPREEKLEEAIGAIRKAMGAYQLEQDTLAREEEARIAARVAPGKGNLSVESAQRRMEAIEKPEEHIAVDGGSVKFRKSRQFEIMDITMLPIEYHLPDETAIRKALQKGVELPGVRYFDQMIPVNSR